MKFLENEPEGNLFLIAACAQNAITHRGKDNNILIKVSGTSFEQVANFYRYTFYLFGELQDKYKKKLFELQIAEPRKMDNGSFIGTIKIDYVTYVDGYPNEQLVIENKHKQDPLLMANFVIMVDSGDETKKIRPESMNEGVKLAGEILEEYTTGNNKIYINARDELHFAELMFVIRHYFDIFLDNAPTVPFTYNVYNPKPNDEGGLTGLIALVFKGCEKEPPLSEFERQFLYG